MENWEKYGDYVIGASLILVAVYFFLQEGQHLVADADGNIVVAGCGCGQSHPTTDISMPTTMAALTHIMRLGGSLLRQTLKPQHSPRQP